MSGLDLDIRCSGSDGFQLAVKCQLPAGSTTAVYGPSGSGKTTLLNCVAGLRQTDDGSKVRFGDLAWQDNGVLVPTWRRRIGFVFQDARLFPHLDVRRNLLYAIKRAGPAALPMEDVCRWLALEELLPRQSHQLSAGQKQRVAIARALLSGPQLLLLDEPLANLDVRARRQCLHGLRKARDALGLPMLYISHDIEEASHLADYLLVLEAGALKEQGPLIDLTSRLDTVLAHQEQAAAIATGYIANHDTHYGLTELKVEGQSLWVNHLEGDIDSSRRIRIPARDVSICRERPAMTSILNILEVNLSEIEETADARVLLRLKLGQQVLLARITRKSAEALALEKGDTLYAQIKSAALLNEAGDTP